MIGFTEFTEESKHTTGERGIITIMINPDKTKQVDELDIATSDVSDLWISFRKDANIMVNQILEWVIDGISSVLSMLADSELVQWIVGLFVKIKMYALLGSILFTAMIMYKYRMIGYSAYRRLARMADHIYSRVRNTGQFSRKDRNEIKKASKELKANLLGYSSENQQDIRKAEKKMLTALNKRNKVECKHAFKELHDAIIKAEKQLIEADRFWDMEKLGDLRAHAKATLAAADRDVLAIARAA